MQSLTQRRVPFPAPEAPVVSTVSAGLVKSLYDEIAALQQQVASLTATVATLTSQNAELTAQLKPQE